LLNPNRKISAALNLWQRILQRDFLLDLNFLSSGEVNLWHVIPTGAYFYFFPYKNVVFFCDIKKELYIRNMTILYDFLSGSVIPPAIFNTVTVNPT